MWFSNGAANLTPDSAPANVVLPTISGTAMQGNTLTASYGTWSGVPVPTLAGRWTRNGVSINGATGQSYFLTAEDIGTLIAFVVVATNSIGTATATSASTSAVAAIPPPAGGVTGPTNTTLPSILGSALVDHYLNVSYGIWTHTYDVSIPRPIFSYQWYRDGVPISGANDPVYVPVADDVGKVIKVREYAQDINGTTFADSANTAIVAVDNRTTVTAADAGLKNTQTTGSITSGLYDLVVASATGFAVNDPIIVEVGTETGAGAQNTMGVGGRWPSVAAADLAALTAIPDGSYALGQFAHTTDTGQVYRKIGTSSWQAVVDPYMKWAMPVALKTTVTAIVGNTLTLALPAQATATAANVYFDNAPRMLAIGNAFNSSVLRASKKLVFLSGTYAFGQKVYMERLVDVRMVGAGKTSTIWKAPYGCPPFASHWRGPCVRPFVSDIGIIGTNTDTTTIPAYTPGGLEGPSGLATRNGAFIIESGTGGFFQDINFTNEWQAMSVYLGSHVWARRCHGEHTGQLIYIQWHFQWSDTQFGGSIDCSQTNERYMAAHETFRSRGVRFYRFTGINANTSCNTSGDWLWEDTHLTFDPDGDPAPYQILSGTPFQDCNSNVGNTSGGNGNVLLALGGEFRRSVLIQKTYFANNTIGVGFICGPGNVNVKYTNCSYDAPDWQSGVTNNLVYAFKSDVSDQSVELYGFIAKNKPNTGIGIENIRFPSATGGKVTNSVSDEIKAANQSGNQTRAAFVSGGGNLNRTSPPA